MELIEKIKGLISEGQTEKALNILVEYSKSKDPVVERQALLLSGQFQQWKRENSLGISKSNNELRRIELSIMELLDGYQVSKSQEIYDRPAVATKKKSTNWMPILMGILGVAVLGFAFLYFSGGQSQTQNETPAINNEEPAISGEITTTETTAPPKEEKEPTTSTKITQPTTTPAKVSAISKYKTIPLVGKTWMSQNLNEPSDGSICFNEDSYNCTTLGRLYTFEAAKKVCATLGDGWRLPNNADWKSLTRTYGGAYADLDYDGKQAFQQLSKGGSTGFNAELGGKRIYFQDHKQFVFYDAKTIGYYWSDEDKSGSPEEARMYTFRSSDNTLLYESIPKTDYISCRCVKD